MHEGERQGITSHSNVPFRDFCKISASHCVCKEVGRKIILSRLQKSCIDRRWQNKQAVKTTIKNYTHSVLIILKTSKLVCFLTKVHCLLNDVTFVSLLECTPQGLSIIKSKEILHCNLTGWVKLQPFLKGFNNKN